MSIDINWQILTEGPDGIKVAEKIRDFVHAKFQTAQLPRFVKGVKVHTFDPGSIAPQIEIMDICDPMPDFYEEIDSEDDYHAEEEKEDGDGFVRPRDSYQEDLRNRPRIGRDVRTNEPSQSSHRPLFVDTRLPGLRSIQIPGEGGSPFLGVSTPGIPGGTSNRSYFHSHLATGLSAAQTPLAAVAGAHLPNGWPDYSYLPPSMKRHCQTASGDCVSPPRSLDSNPRPSLREKGSVSTLATSAGTTRPQTRDGIIEDLVEEEPTSSPRRFREPRTEDVQIVFRVRYAGDVKLSLTAEILLDYPMPSFVGIPVKLNITGISLDGVAVLAYIRKRAHFCFLSPEDAHGAIVAESADDAYIGGTRTGGILHEIKVESEIGQRESGKAVLKNVGKVEKFVLEQVRRIFEDEFVYPSFWTFLV